MKTILALLGLLLFGAAQPQAPAVPAPGPDPAARLAAIERASGGRLGVALLDGEGRLLMSHRADERFALCSTFKLPLAGMHAQTEGAREPMAVTRADLLGNSPYTERVLAGRAEMRVAFAAEAAVTFSDNTAANLLLRRMGGPEEYTRRLRALGDNVTRLDRYELGLNENAQNDPRDTTTPAAMARTASRYVMGDVLQPAWRTQFRSWMIATVTGVRRIRAGLPRGWLVGNKTGTCGTAFNDVAFFQAPGGAEYLLAVYLDRPTVADARAEAAIADVGRLAATVAH
jgi:beta-lactamase class A